SPVERLDEDDARDLRAALEKVQPALREARRLETLPRGRYEVEWKRDLLSTLMPHLESVRTVSTLLEADAVLAAHEGDIETACRSATAAVNAARSIGDEPSGISFLVRIACCHKGVNCAQRALAQGEAMGPTLAAFQKLLEDESRKPLLLQAMRGERGGMFNLMEMLATGEYDLEELSGSRPKPPNAARKVYHWAYLLPIMRRNQAAVLEILTDAVEIARKE